LIWFLVPTIQPSLLLEYIVPLILSILLINHEYLILIPKWHSILILFLFLSLYTILVLLIISLLNSLFMFQFHRLYSLQLSDTLSILIYQLLYLEWIYILITLIIESLYFRVYHFHITFHIHQLIQKVHFIIQLVHIGVWIVFTRVLTIIQSNLNHIISSIHSLLFLFIVVF